MTTLQHKTVFISGASSGIGEACAEVLAKEGARLILCARNIEKLEQIAAKLTKDYGTEIYAFQLDVRNRIAVAEAIKGLPQEFRWIDILINNAGLAAGFEKLQQGEVDDWEAMIDTNIKGLLYLTRLIVPEMIANKLEGQIINIGSLAGVYAYPNGAVYCGTKAAVRFISDGLRMDLVDQPIRVTNIQPGMVETNFSVVRFKGDHDRADQVYQGLKPLLAADIADIVRYCATVPTHVQIGEVTVTPTYQASATLAYRGK